MSDTHDTAALEGTGGGGWGPPAPPSYPPSYPPPDSALGGYPPPGQLPPGYPPPGFPPNGYPPRRRRRGARLAVAAALVIAVGAGIGIDHLFWRPSPVAAQAAGVPSGIPTVPVAPFQPGGGGAAVPTDPSAPDQSSGVSPALTAKVDPQLVIINVALGYQGIQAAGTGMVLTSSGEILTNNHVISGATQITATDVGNGKSYTATVVGYDSAQDMAVLQLQNASGLATVQLGDSSKASVGDTVTAIGNAGGTGSPSAAAGSVTALNQSITAGDEASGSSEQLTGLLQVSADVQPGDSGGPLVDSSGAVIGMDTAGSESTGFQQSAPSQGFALPVNTLVPLAQQIVAGKSGTEVHVGPTAFLGVEVSAATGGAGAGRGGGAGTGAGGTGNGTGEVAGAPVAGVINGSPAAQTALAEGDVITSVGGQSVGSAAALTTLMSAQKPGAHVTVEWTDVNGAQQTATVVLASGPAT